MATPARISSLIQITALILSHVEALPSSLSGSKVPQIPIESSSPTTWTNCTQEPLNGLQCASIAVPLDWKHLETSEFISLVMAKLPASGKASEKIGSLIINPGGPGGSAATTVASYMHNTSYLSEDIRRRFDIIGPDPRGVGYSTPLMCDGTISNERVPRRPENPSEFDILVKQNRELSKSCRKLTGNLVDFMDTASAARDIEAVRLALGDEPLNALAFSYGTQLLTNYAELYPQNARAIVLDGVLDHSQSETYSVVTESQAFETSLNRFFDWCQTPECALYEQEMRPAQLFDHLIEKARGSPVPAPGCRGQCRSDVTDEEIIMAVDGLILRKIGWPRLSQSLKAAIDGNATALSRPLWREGMSDFESNQFFAESGVACQDWFHSSASFANSKYKSQLGAIMASHTQGLCQSFDISTKCIGWDAALTDPPRLANVSGNHNPILMVSSFYDPSTSYAWAEGVRRQIESAVLLSRDGDGHTSYGLAGEASRIMDDYLINLVVPPPNTVVQT